MEKHHHISSTTDTEELSRLQTLVGKPLLLLSIQIRFINLEKRAHLICTFPDDDQPFTIMTTERLLLKQLDIGTRYIKFPVPFMFMPIDDSYMMVETDQIAGIPLRTDV